MNFYPEYQQYVKYSESSRVVPVSVETDSDMETPISLFKKFSTDEYCYLLESVEGGERWARYSFMGRKPLIIFKTVKNKTTVTTTTTTKKAEEYGENPIEVLRMLLSNLKSQTFSHLPRFYGGVVGYFGYDTIRYFENIEDSNLDEIEMPDCHLIVPEEVIVFDHLKQKLYIIVNTIVGDMEPVQDNDKDLFNLYKSANDKIKGIIESISFNTAIEVVNNSSSNGEDEIVGPIDFTGSVSKQEFMNNVIKAKEYIAEGDIFQVVLSQRLKARYPGDPFEVYRKLRTLNPSPYMYFLKFDDSTIVGASPEMLVRVENGKVETCPIAGTRKRGETVQEDEELALDLLNDEKECAEHTMLIDLGRNDVGKVSKFGSVIAKNVMHIEKYSHVMHMVTNVESELRDDKEALDVLTSVLPAGTVSGAPKVRAMQIIEELENKRRGVYAGGIGYIGFDGNLDTCIAIRTAIFKEGNVYVQAGAGIVADSIPESEYVETLNKAQALITAIKKAGERI